MQRTWKNGQLGFVLTVTDDFVAGDLAAVVDDNSNPVAHVVVHEWATANVVLVSSFNPDFHRFVSAANISTVVGAFRDLKMKKLSETGVNQPVQDISALSTFGKAGADWSAFGENYQWALILHRAITLKAPGENGGDPNKTTYDSPVWNLYADEAKTQALEGAGVVIGTLNQLPSASETFGLQFAGLPADPIILHPEFQLYRSYTSTPIDMTSSGAALAPIYAEDPAAGEVHKLGGVIHYNYGPSGPADGNGVIPFYTDADQPPATDALLLDATTNTRAHALSQIAARGVGRKTLTNGTAHDGSILGQPQPVPNGSFPERDGVSFIAAKTDGDAATENHEQLGPYFGSHYKGDYDAGVDYRPRSGIFGGFLGFTPHLSDVVASGGKYWECLAFNGPTYGVQAPAEGAFWTEVSAEDAGLQGRMRGLAPCAKVICYYSSEGPGFPFDPLFSGDYIMALEAALRHNVQVWVEPYNVSYSGEVLDVLKTIWDHVWVEVKKSKMVFVQGAGHLGTVEGPLSENLRAPLFGDKYNCVLVGGVGPRYYDQNDANLNEFVPVFGRYPQLKDYNLARPSLIALGYSFNFSGNSQVEVGGGSTISNKIDFCAAQGGNDPALLFATADAPYYTNPGAVNNSFVYGATALPGIYVNFGVELGAPDSFFGAGINALPNVGHHGMNVQEQSPACLTAAAAALALEARKIESGSFPSNPKKAISDLQKGTIDGLGPSEDSAIISFPAGSSKFRKIVDTTPGASKIVSPFQVGNGWDPGPAQNPWNANVTLRSIDQAVLFDMFGFPNSGLGSYEMWYLPTYPADRNGKDTMYGKGVLSVKSSVRKILSIADSDEA